MPYLPGKIPFRGWITDSPYSAVPDGYTADILNIMPADPFRRRVRLGTRAVNFVKLAGIDCAVGPAVDADAAGHFIEIARLHLPIFRRRKKKQADAVAVVGSVAE